MIFKKLRKTKFEFKNVCNSVKLRGFTSYKQMIQENKDEQVQKEIINFFFGELPNYNSPPSKDIPQKWYRVDKRQDMIMKNIFGEFVVGALEKKLSYWKRDEIGWFFLLCSF